MCYLEEKNILRIAPLCDDLKKALLYYRQCFTKNTEPYDFVCCHEDRTPFYYKRNFRHHKRALERANVKYRSGHAYRHSFSTNLKVNNLASSRDLRVTSGWADESIQDRYTHTEMSSTKNVTEA